jgi:hypothetical protein
MLGRGMTKLKPTPQIDASIDITGQRTVKKVLVPQITDSLLAE